MATAPAGFSIDHGVPLHRPHWPPGSPVAWAFSADFRRGLWLDVEDWPPRHIGPSAHAPQSLVYTPAAAGHGACWAMLTVARAGQPAALWLSHCVPDEGDASWRPVPLPAFTKGEPSITLHWHAADLLLADRHQVWRYPALAQRPAHTEPAAPELLFAQSPAEMRHGKHTAFCSAADGSVYWQCTGRLWQWNGVAVSGIDLPIDGFCTWQAVALGERGLSWINGHSREWLAWDGQQTRQAAHVSPAVGDEVRSGPPGWVFSFSAADRRAPTPLCQAWHPASGEHRFLPRGALGSHALNQWFTRADGVVVAGDESWLTPLGSADEVLAACRTPRSR